MKEVTLIKLVPQSQLLNGTVVSRPLDSSKGNSSPVGRHFAVYDKENDEFIEFGYWVAKCNFFFFFFYLLSESNNSMIIKNFII